MSAPEDCRPDYPLRHTYKQAVAWTIMGLSEKPNLPRMGTVAGRFVSAADIKVRDIVKASVTDQMHRAQLEAWCRAQANPKDQDLSFARACQCRGWNERSAHRHVEDALAMVFFMLNRPS